MTKLVWIADRVDRHDAIVRDLERDGLEPIVRVDHEAGQAVDLRALDLVEPPIARFAARWRRPPSKKRTILSLPQIGFSAARRLPPPS
jgi:hypothetical protein